MSAKQKLCDLADSWDKEAASLLIGTDADDIDDRVDRALALYLRTCAAELRRVISEVEKESPEPPDAEVRAAICQGCQQKVAGWYHRVMMGETGDSFGECVQ